RYGWTTRGYRRCRRRSWRHSRETGRRKLRAGPQEPPHPALRTQMIDLDRLFREYHQPLVRYLARRLGDRDWAEEVAQETFLRAARQESLTSERSWLFAVATNLVRDEARKDARRRRHLELLRAEAQAEEAVEPEPTTLERAQEAALARRAVDALG